MLELINIKKRLANFTLSIDNLNIHDNDYFVILGLSGAGKSTLLEIIAGYKKPDKGRIYLDGEDITNKSIHNRKIVLCHGKYLFPHLTVYENIGLGVKKDKDKKVKEIAELLGISHLLNRKPKTLSGGEQQRVALAMALAVDPKIILLDEPLANVDVLIKENLISELKKIYEETDKTFIHVTHDFVEAISLAKRIAIIKDGKIEQCDKLEKILKKPKNRFVAEFMGYKNFLDGEIVDGEFVGNIKLKLNEDLNIKRATLAIRPEDIILVGGNGCKYKEGEVFEAKILDIYPKTLSTYKIILDVNGCKLIAEIIRSKALRMKLSKGKKVKISIASYSIIQECAPQEPLH
ncbi:ABC transporter ATP-binding protein [Methanocaldococcus sp.]